MMWYFHATVLGTTTITPDMEGSEYETSIDVLAGDADAAPRGNNVAAAAKPPRKKIRQPIKYVCAAQRCKQVFSLGSGEEYRCPKCGWQMLYKQQPSDHPVHYLAR